MRIVKWNPQERVDTPDLTAMSYLVLGEFRRSARGILFGAADATPNYIINGFAVEAQAVPDATARVRLDVSGVFSYALGAELIGSRVDYGQLIGGDDSNGNTEGNATQTVDFTGQPANTYTVEMRFIYTGGVLDNRAFWNPTGNTEFISAVQTRTLSGFDLRFSGAPSGEWIPLADVVWAGAGTVDPGDITDVREFALEGTAPFQQITQLGSGGIANFSRSTDRAAIGLNAVYPALRGLARQVQDLKGADDSGNWNWWNNPYKPLDPSSTLTEAQSTSLRSLRTAHFTVGDGIRTFGDFNGYTLGTGLDQCLAHIETEDANIEGHVIIQILVNPDGGAGTAAFEIGNYAFDKTVVEIRGGGSTATDSGEYWYGSRIDPSGTLTTEAFSLNNGGGTQGGLILRDLFFLDTGVDTELFDVGAAAHFEMRGCRVETQGDPVDPTINISGNAHTFVVEDSYFEGGHFLVRNASAGVAEFWISLTNVVFLNADWTIQSADRVMFTRCSFSNTTGDNNLVTIEDSEQIIFSVCRFHYGGLPDYDLVHVQDIINPCSDIHWLDCHFTQFGLGGGAQHAPNTGTNGTAGTGWCIYIDASSAQAAEARGFVIRNCAFDGNGHQGFGVVDSGAIYALECNSIKIDGCDFNNWDLLAGGSPFSYMIHLDNPGSGDAPFGSVTNCVFDEWDNTVAGTIQGIRLTGQKQCFISGNKFELLNADAGIFVDNCDGGVIEGNMLENGITTEVILIANSTGMQVRGNSLDACAYGIAFIVSTDSVCANNVVRGGNVTLLGSAVIIASSARTSIMGNVITNYNGTYNAIDLTSSTSCAVFGNISSDGNHESGAGAGHIGNTAAGNIMNAFT